MSAAKILSSVPMPKRCFSRLALLALSGCGALQPVRGAQQEESGKKAQTDKLFQAIEQKKGYGVKELLPTLDEGWINTKKEGKAALHLAVGLWQLDTVELLLSQPGVYVNIRDHPGERTPLHVAIEERSAQLVQALLAHQEIHVNQAAADGENALIKAAVSGHTGILEALLAHQYIEVNDRANPSAWERSPECCYPYGVNALGAAAWENKWAIVEKLLADGRTDVNLRDDKMSTALAGAATKGFTKVLRELLKHGDIEINLQDNNGNTALHEAAAHGHTDFVEDILACPAIEVNLENHGGDSAVSLAARGGHADTVKLLTHHPEFRINEHTISMSYRHQDDRKDKNPHIAKMMVGAFTTELNLWAKDREDRYLLIRGYLRRGQHNLNLALLPDDLVKYMDSVLCTWWSCTKALEAKFPPDTSLLKPKDRKLLLEVGGKLDSVGNPPGLAWRE